MLGDLSPLSA